MLFIYGILVIDRGMFVYTPEFGNSDLSNIHISFWLHDQYYQ